MRRPVKIVLIIILLLMMAAGVLMVAYPLISTQYNAKHHSDIMLDYDQQIQQQDTSKIDAALEAAKAYNLALFNGKIIPTEFAENGYFELLNLSGSGLMGYVEIPAINVKVPFYHGVSETVLQKGAGHMPPTSLPVGGENTHATISAHSGMASMPMFTDLELLDIGDVFYIHVLGQTLRYEVEFVDNMVDPDDVSDLQIQRDRDLVTLVTCTPVGINTHRLIVRGCRAELPIGQEVVEETISINTEETSVFYTMYYEGLILALKLSVIPLVITIILVLIIRRKRKKSEN